MNNNTFLKFKELLKFVFENKYSDFYRAKFQKAGFNAFSDFNSIDDIKKIPFLTKEELLGVDPSKLLFVPEKEVDFISTTSGTTGKSSSIFHPKYGVPDCDRPWLKPGKTAKIWLLFHPSGALTAYLAYKSFKNRSIWLLVGDIYNLPLSCQSVAKLGINIIYTTPTIAIILKDYLERYPNLKKSLKVLVLSGELLTPNKKKLLRELYPDIEIFGNYSLLEIAMSGGIKGIGTQCRHLAQKEDETYYHLTKTNDIHFEIINFDTGKEVKFGEKGELVATVFDNRATPLIRYKTGDLVSFKENGCPCGAPGPLLQVWGRANYDVVKAGGFNLTTKALEKPLLNLRDCLQDVFEVHIYENFFGTKPKIKLLLNLSLKEKVKESLELTKRVENEFLENWQFSSQLNLKGAVEAGLFEHPQINFVKFPKSPKAKRALILH